MPIRTLSSPLSLIISGEVKKHTCHKRQCYEHFFVVVLVVNFSFVILMASEEMMFDFFFLFFFFFFFSFFFANLMFPLP